ncbi:hypothetical protein [Streptomyces broussonetiae]|uniref:Uncharacterized protein n=1 Tax=Streptomyces broussonetiae TaxID=2686304 RepID=A0A6I6N8J5_9ACTN|nr:hypothetical protein [Streptomyces broussonetiae]QHA09223.1 hypothetical protein GQF42_43955 [Streptomyces broussonetiae]
MPSLESLEKLLRAIGEQAVRGLRALDPPGGADRALRNAAQAAAAASVERREHDAVSAWLAQRNGNPAHPAPLHNPVTAGHSVAGAGAGAVQEGR